VTFRVLLFLIVTIVEIDGLILMSVMV